MCVDLQIITRNGQTNSKKILVHVIDTLYINLNKIFENKNDKIRQFLRIFYQNLEALEKKWVKNEICILTLRSLPEMAKTFQKNICGACFS